MGIIWDVWSTRRRWSQSPTTSDQLHLQAPTTTFYSLDMALRAAGDQDRGKDKGQGFLPISSLA